MPARLKTFMSGTPDPRYSDPPIDSGRKGVTHDGLFLRPCAAAKWYTPGSGTGKGRNEKELRRTGELPGAIGYNVASSYGRESMSDINTMRQETKRLADPDKAKILQRFFKTGTGQYGEGDVFAGITVPVIRKLVRKHQDIQPAEAFELLRSPIHEERLLALLIL